MVDRRRRTMETLRADLDAANAAPYIGQKKAHSFLEAIFGTAVGFLISWLLLSLIISPLFHLRTNAGEDFLITCVFTIASIIRSYAVRRLFNWWHTRESAA